MTSKYGAEKGQDFYSHFREEVNIIQSRIDLLSDATLAINERDSAVERCLIGIASLSNEVKEISTSLPAHDQRSYSETIKSLSSRLQQAREASTPRAKFTFKSVRRVKAPTSSTGTAQRETLEEAQASQKDRQSKFTPQNDSAETGAFTESAAPNGLAITDRSCALVKPDAGESDKNLSSMSFSRLSRCVVHVAGLDSIIKSFASLTLKTIELAIVISGRVEGPVHCTGLEGSVLVVSCRQLRMHESRNCDVYLHCASRPIIEGCKGIRFAPLPDALENAWPSTDMQNKWDHVDDFNWLSAERSPNWRALMPDERIHGAVWTDQILKASDDEVENTLTSVGISIR